ncbi:MAG: hypothetical protein FalmKO_30830 [Falsiruegeria mediterranea]|jgi:hypothetical protein
MKSNKFGTKPASQQEPLETQVQIERTTVQTDTAAHIAAAASDARMGIEGRLHGFAVRTASCQHCKTDKGE